MYSHPLSGSVSPSGVPTTGAQPAEKRPVTGIDTAKSAEFKRSPEFKALLARLHQLPEVRANVVADAAARLKSGELFNDSETIARTILGNQRQ
jgi:hypothetical protein